MDQLIEFFRGLFSYSEWPARWHCGYWSDFHGWLYILSDGLIWFAYFAIPTIILNYFNKKRDLLHYRHGYFLFAAFILLCGSTHYMDILMFWFPMYRLNALIRFATGVVSIITVFYLIKILPEMFKLRTSIELEAEIEKRLLVERHLKEANRSLQTFAYLASHDLQEPLRKISMFTSSLSENTQDSLDETNQTLINKIGSSATRLQTMIKDILNLSNIQSTIELRAVDPTISVRNALDELDLKVKELNAEVNVEQLPEVLGYNPYLEQLFVNLISNALKFSAPTPSVSITGEKKGDKVLIKLSDNGIGMNQEDTEKIFEAFRRLVPRNQYEGTGLGLAICKRIVDAHNGAISVLSSPGEGTTFTIELRAAG
jgi:two-component system, chemotaxis family, sensor kinase Cph1